MSAQSYRKKDDSNHEEDSSPEKQESAQYTQNMQNTQQDGKKRDREKERVQLDFSTDAIHRLDLLKNQLDTTTRAEVIRLALRLLEWFVTETGEDDTIEVTNKEGKVLTRFKVKLLYVNRA
ncbi:MAG TPA: hypothetical protein VKR06_27175 [Ktedonosporobacter sp.]|nr:hypothetical protein [Ktedonosporobacter sp.]